MAKTLTKTTSGDAKNSPTDDQMLRRSSILSVLSVASCVITRAPSIVDKISVPYTGLSLVINAGHVLLLAPYLLLALAIWVTTANGQRIPQGRRSSVKLFAGAVFLLPAIGAIFLAGQFFLLIAPPGECNGFDRWRYLLDFSLKAFKPEYCMGLPKEVQDHMPWLINPPVFQGWLVIAVAASTAILSMHSLRKWSSQSL